MKNQLLPLAVLIIAGNIMVSRLAVAQEVLDKAQYKFYYEYAFEFDTLTLNDRRESLIILQVGQNVSKSYSYPSFYYDSLRASPEGEMAMKQIRRELVMSMVETGKPHKGFVSGAMVTRVYKNHPEGQITVSDQISSNHYMYTDELHAQNWLIMDSTKTILDYPCQMAVSDFRGRRWIAWFAPDIPINDGPWKFSGLPGLIMEVHDSGKHFHFTLVGIEQVDNEPIVFSPVVLSYQSYGKHEKTTRIEFLRGLARFRGNSSSIMNAELGRETFDESGSNVRHNDLIERDYRR